MKTVERMARPYRYGVESCKVDFKLLRDSWDLRPPIAGMHGSSERGGVFNYHGKASSNGELARVTIKVGKGMGE
ncbi:MAG: hypothetical protein QXJ64_08160 [Thermosphaera sp.]